MAKPSTQNRPNQSNRQHPPLRVVGGGQGKRPSPMDRVKKTIRKVLVAFFVVAGILVYQSVNRPLDPGQSLDTFAVLHDILRKEGVSRFLAEKEELKKTVKMELGESAPGAKFAEAQSIAVYLFPDLLPDEDFEKPVALELWHPLQKAIEAEPGTAKSRTLFNEMRANIWNYESPDRSTPRLSDQARQVIRIYENLSAP